MAPNKKEMSSNSHVSGASCSFQDGIVSIINTGFVYIHTISISIYIYTLQEEESLCLLKC